MATLFDYGLFSARGPISGLIRPLSAAEAWTYGRLYRSPEGRPALVAGGEGVVYGRLLSGLADSQLPLIDALFGVHQGVMARVEVRAVRGLAGVTAWTWVSLAERPGVRLPKGRWRFAVRRL